MSPKDHPHIDRTPIPITTKFFYICHGFPSAAFDTLEKAENSAEFQMTSVVKFYEIRNGSDIRYVYTAHYNDTQEQRRLMSGR